MVSKAELREKFLKNKCSNPENIELAILLQIELFLSKHNGLKSIGLYFPLYNEIDIMSVFLKYRNNNSRNNHTKFALPKIVDDEIIYAQYNLGTKMEQNEKYPLFMQPISDKEIVPEVIFVPALAYDIRGYRLGRGKGHFDKYLAKHGSKITKIGVISGSGVIEYLPNESHDYRMDYIITEDMVLDLCN